MKYYGNIGFAVSEEEMIGEQHTGNWKQKITVRPYYGELSDPVNRFTTGVGVNDDKNFSAKLSIVSDPFAVNNFHSIRFAEYLGVRWEVTSVEFLRPRLILTLGGRYVQG